MSILRATASRLLITPAVPVIAELRELYLLKMQYLSARVTELEVILLGEKCVVTGGAGFIGSNLVHRLVRDGNRVTVIDNLSTGNQANLEDIRSEIEFNRGDIRDTDLLKDTFSGASIIFHEAAMVSVTQSMEEPLRANDINAYGTLCVLSAAKEAGVKRVVLAASSAVYGDSPILPKEESLVPNPMSPYALTKYVSELYARIYSNLYGLETVALRCFNVYGPRQDPDSEYAAVIPRFIMMMLQGRRPIIFGDGTQSRDFVYVDDVVEANLRAAHLPDISGQVINVGNGEGHSINHLVEILNQAMGTSYSPIYRSARRGDPTHSVASTTRMQQLLLFSPSFSLEAGLERTVRWYEARFPNLTSRWRRH